MSLLKKDILKFVLDSNPADFFFISYDLLTMPDKCQVAGKIEREADFIFKFLENYIFHGSDCFNYLKDIPRESVTVNILFDQENLSNVQKQFQGFDCSDKSGEGPFNHFLNMSCSKSQFKRDLNIKMEGVRALALEDWTNNAPTYVKNFLEQLSTCYGFVQDGKLVSCTPSPNIYLGNEAPKCAIIRGVWTDPNYRGNGLATSSMNALCLELFDTLKVEQIYLRVEERNPAAIRIYKKLGFHMAGNWWGSQCLFK
jgi:GNAT superfamily N-acetyltransferase